GAVRSTGTTREYQEPGSNLLIGSEQEQQADRHRGDANIVRQGGPPDQPPAPGDAGQIDEAHAQADGRHHLDQRERDEDIDRRVYPHKPLRISVMRKTGKLRIERFGSWLQSSCSQASTNSRPTKWLMIRAGLAADRLPSRLVRSVVEGRRSSWLFCKR